MTDKKTDTKDSLLTLQPPHNIEMERALLSSLMSIENSFDSIDTMVTADDFYGARHGQIFDAIAHLARINEPYDSLMVHDYLSRVNQLAQVGGEEYLLQINQSPANFFNLVTYAQRVRELSVYRQLIKSANTMLNLAYHPKKQSVTEILDQVEADIFRIGESFANGTNKEGPRRIDDILESITHELNEIRLRDGGLAGISSGFEDLDNKTQGFQDGNLIILAARPAMGKTALALNFAQAALMQNKAVAVFSMEMSAEDIGRRMISAWGNIEQRLLMTADMKAQDWASVMNAMSLLQETHLYVDARSELTPTEVRATCRRLAKNHPEGLGLVIIDYLQLMRVHGAESRVNEIGEISRSLKALARELNCPVIALAQLNRSLESRPNKRPLLSDLRESGQIEQDADLILFVYRGAYYKMKTDQEDPSKNNNQVAHDPAKDIEAELIIGKNRRGATGTVYLNFYGQYAKFESRMGESIPEYAYDSDE